MNTANNILAIQAAADRCTFRHGAHVTVSIIDDAARLNLSDAELASALNSGFIPGPVALMDSPSVKSLIRAARLTDIERELVAHKIASNDINTPAELRAYLQELARARVAARCAKLAPLPEGELADVARLSGQLARSQRAAEVAERDHAIYTGALTIQTPAPQLADVATLSGNLARAFQSPCSGHDATVAASGRGVEEIPAQGEPALPIVPTQDDNGHDDPDRTLDIPAPDFTPPASRPDLEVYRPTRPALPGKGGQARSAQGNKLDAQGNKLARAKDVLKSAEKKAAHLAQAERVVVVAGDLAWVESSDGQARYRVDFEDGVPVFCGCRDPRASFGGCKHADAAAECRAQGDGTYHGTINPKPFQSPRSGRATLAHQTTQRNAAR